MKFIKKKAAVPPLGLITASALLPSDWQKKLIDMNVSKLDTRDIIWADYVFISAMSIQKESVERVISECVKHKTKIVAGGPLFTQEYKKYFQIEHFVLNEAEITLPLFLEDLSRAKPERVYKTSEFADLSLSPVPDYHLLESRKYAFMNIQISRGCPYACDFCEITYLPGYKVRMKKPVQIIKELEALYRLNWRGSVFITDDNFIGNKKEIKNGLLPVLKDWMRTRKYPFSFNIQSSINLADDNELLTQLVETGFTSSFIGIETPDDYSLQACNKVQNKSRDLLQCVKKIQNSGLQVSGGFIVGFDSDTPGVFQRQIDFIQKSGIVSAMVGLLNAPKNTVLYKRLESENRLTDESNGNNTDLRINFIPKMNYSELVEGYKKIIENIYSIKPYYNRIRQFLLNYTYRTRQQKRLDLSIIKPFFKSVFILGIANKGRIQYWKLLVWTLFNRPELLTDAITYAIFGYHFRIVYGIK